MAFINNPIIFISTILCLLSYGQITYSYEFTEGDYLYALHGGIWNEIVRSKDNEYHEKSTFSCVKISGQIEWMLVCDGKRDCIDGTDEDEYFCHRYKCWTDAYQCKHIACEENNATFNHNQHCFDGTQDIILEGEIIEPNDTSSYQDAYCVLPTVDGVIYYSSSNQILSPGTSIPHQHTVLEKCKDGYQKALSNGFRFCQTDGKWKINTENLCLKMCPPLVSDSLDIKCTVNGKYANCSNLSKPNTLATTLCKPAHSLQNENKNHPFELLCQSNGMWNNQLNTCIPNCGQVYIKNEPQIGYGVTAMVGTAPWNVAIYKLKINKRNFQHKFICGGSLIAPNLVVSAAHCFWERNMPSNISINDGLYKIAVGKYDRDITVKDNDFTQIINVSKIYLKDTYHGSLGNYVDDIAVIVLQDRISISNGVSLVCVDWNNNYNVENGDLGKVVGWGLTETLNLSPFLQEASLSYINRMSCQRTYQNDTGFKKSLTVDKFCAGSKNGQFLGDGDSGAGLTFKHTNSYYLTGVVSIKDKKSTKNTIVVLTDVKQNIEWIRDLYNQTFF